MVEAYHVVMTCYGFWLPNDERGSGSRYIGSKALCRFGKATHVDSQWSVAHQPHNKSLRLEAKKHLKYPPVIFDGLQARAVGRGFGSYIQKSDLVVYACAILPDHVHLVIQRHRLTIEQIMIKLKAAATMQLLAESRHPFQKIVLPDGQHPKVFAREGRHVFLNNVDEIEGRISYVRENPIKAGLPEQFWSFVREYEA